MAKGSSTNTLKTVALALVVIGGLNWGLTALGYNVVNLLLGSIPVLEQVVYLVVALAALYVAYTMVKK